MYAGAGTFSVFLADIFKKTTLVEHNRDALVHAELNLAGKPHETYGLSGSRWVKENAPQIIEKNGNFDAVIIDPPRSGMERDAVQWPLQNKNSPDKKHFLRSLHPGKRCNPLNKGRLQSKKAVPS